jgi:hypothetical protein
MKSSRRSIEDSSISKFKERLVALSVDLDDKSKLCSSITSRIERERMQIANAEESVAQEFSADLEVRSSSARSLLAHR